MSSFVVALALLLVGPYASERMEPIIDVHLHAYPPDEALPPPQENPVTGIPTGLANGEQHLHACLAQMKRFNIRKGFVSGGSGDRLAAARHWANVAPDQIVSSVSLRGSAAVPLPDLATLRQALEEGRFGALGEVTAQYAGLSLSNAEFEPYLALADELDLPVALHTGLSFPGISYDPCCRNFRTALGNPENVEEALNRHPKLRLSLMHGGWPYLQETIAIMSVYPQVYADLGGINWAIPRAEFHEYLRALVRAGSGSGSCSVRIRCFGRRPSAWPWRGSNPPLS